MPIRAAGLHHSGVELPQPDMTPLSHDKGGSCRGSPAHALPCVPPKVVPRLSKIDQPGVLHAQRSTC